MARTIRRICNRTGLDVVFFNCGTITYQEVNPEEESPGW
jgi:hypothetical protein